MTTYTLDTHATIKQLEDAGMDSSQAEVVVAAISRSDAELATKADLKAEIAELKTDMFKVAMGVAIAIILANATMTIALIRFLA
ncbi:hypothetical protein F4X90_15235 [Candidatus Poribacteria bacterium]|nr:hypothetical protein [Candidatus Poribacteria bacterium]